MPRTREAIDEGQELETIDLAAMPSDLLTVYKLGLVFLELLNDVEQQRGNYHTVGANRLHTKYLVTSNCNNSKFYAGGARLADLLVELLEEYNWSDKSAVDALQAAVLAFKTTKVK
jgi:hypothetical protein